MMNEQERKEFEHYWSAENKEFRMLEITNRELFYENDYLTKKVEKLKNELQALKRENRVLKGLPEEEPEPEPEPQPDEDAELAAAVEDTLDKNCLPVRCIAGQIFNYAASFTEDQRNVDIDYTDHLFDYPKDFEEDPLTYENVDDEPKRNQTKKFSNHMPEFKSVRFYPIDDHDQGIEKKEEFYDVEEDVEEEFVDVESIQLPSNPNATGDAFGRRSLQNKSYPHFEFKKSRSHSEEPLVRTNDFGIQKSLLELMPSFEV